MPSKKAGNIKVEVSSSDVPDHVGRFKNRIKELRYVAASDLHGHPKNWRTHPSEQVSLLSRLMDEIGMATALPVMPRKEGGYTIIDGHLRTGMIGDEGTIPVLILDVSEQEAEKLVASVDPIVLMAEGDLAKLEELLNVDLFDDPTIVEDLSHLLLPTETDFQNPKNAGATSVGSLVEADEDFTPSQIAFKVYVVVDSPEDRDKAAALLSEAGYMPQTEVVRAR